MTLARLIAKEPGLSGSATLLLALLFGLLTGFAEVAVRGLAQIAGRPDPLVSVHYIWMTPLACTALFVLVAGPLAIVGSRRRISSALVMTLLLFLAALGPLLAMNWLARWAQFIAAAGLAVQAARILTPRTSNVLRLSRYAVPGLSLLLVLTAAGMTAGQVVRERRAIAGLGDARAGTPNILLIILDTVRAASMSLYGSEHPTTPNLEEFSLQGVVFDHAWSTSPWTLPSHASLFTGRHSWELSTDLITPLDDTFPTLAEHFSGHGYATAGFTANIRYGNRMMGLSRGFLHYEGYPISPAMIANSSTLTRRLATKLLRTAGIDEKLVRKSGRSLTDDFLSWQDANPGRPFFAFLNYFDAHAPYLPPDSLAGRFGPRRQKRAMHDLSNFNGWKPDEIAAERAAYKESLASIDHQLSRLFNVLSERGILDNTVVVVTSDHGEQFGEHGLMDHGNSLYVQLLRVPLIIRFPRAIPAGVRIETPVSLRDLAVTLTELSSTGPSPFPGTSLLSHLTADTASPAPLYSEVREGIRTAPWLPLAKGTMYSAVLGDFHYIVNGDGTEELFDLSIDPDELVDLSDSSRARATLQRAREELERLRNGGTVTLLGRAPPP
ncbi:MAG TPA: sulfatase [Longimicrobiales bacterium]|nr:sulfatase [Longimicrobiales bacterium]